jgi:hypothetical protein
MRKRARPARKSRTTPPMAPPMIMVVGGLDEEFCLLRVGSDAKIKKQVAHGNVVFVDGKLVLVVTLGTNDVKVPDVMKVVGFPCASAPVEVSKPVLVVSIEVVNTTTLSDGVD